MVEVYPFRYSGDVNFVSPNMMTSGFRSLMSQSKYRCFSASLMPRTFQRSTFRGTLLILRFLLAD